MIEIPEASTITQQLNEVIKRKRIMNVTAAQHPHKFAWYFGDPQGYHELLCGKVVSNSISHGGLIEIMADDTRILLGDGVNLRYFEEGEKLPDKHQLHIEFEDYSSIIASVQMYGGLWAYPEGQNTNPYYLVAKDRINPLQEGFNEAYFNDIVSQNSQKLSIKAFLASEQRIPGLGNGVLQDILFNAKVHPKKKLNTLNASDIKSLFHSIKITIAEMAFNGGRDTESDLFGCSGGYKTKLSKNTVDKPCSICGDIIRKEAYMGGSIYYCPTCQRL